jgi:hypothetical protein
MKWSHLAVTCDRDGLSSAAQAIATAIAKHNSSHHRDARHPIDHSDETER